MALPCNNLNLNLYRVFYTVAKTKSFSESATVLHISQPAISKHIQNLEYELNTVLFYRNNRGIELTPEAKSLLTYVEKAYNFLMLGEKELQESKELLKGKVSIGVPTFISVYLLSSYVKEFMELHPNIVVKMSNKKMSDLYNLLYQHTLDLLIVTGNNNIPKDFKVVSLGKENYVFCYNEDKMKDLNKRRVEKQPLEYPSAGSTFKRPEGYFAGKLIQDSGLAGYSVGGAMVSPKHCGFVVNYNNATAKDIYRLIEDVTRIVYEKYSVKLEPEVRLIGVF